MAKLTKAETKLLQRGFDWATDTGGYDPAWDDDAVLEYLQRNPNESIMSNVAKALSLPVHRVVTARNRLEKAGKLPKAETLTEFVKKSSPVCSQPQLVTTITLWQPWATFIVKGIKRFETRSWIPNYKGRILIHASSRKLNWLEVPLTALREECPELENWDYPLGAIVGEAELINCHRSEAVRDKLSPLEQLCGDYSDGRYAWELANIKPLFIPNVKGHQKLWRYELNRSQQQSVVTTIVTTKSPLEQEPPRLIDENGQLSLFYDTSDEAPDPDDFQNLADYEKAWEEWAELHPELAAEFKKDIAFEGVGTTETAEPPTEQPIGNTKEASCALNGETARADDSCLTSGDTFSSGDYVQLKSDPRRIGKLTIAKGKYKVSYADGFKAEHDKDELTLFSKADSEIVLGESFFKVGERVKCLLPTENRIFTVNTIYPTGMVSVLTGLDTLSTLSYPANWLEHYVEEIKPSNKQETPKKKRPAKGCGSGYLRVREANKKRNAAKGKDPDIYYVYYYSYSNQYGKEVKGSISVPRMKVSQVKKLIESGTHYVEICKYLGKSVPCWY